MRTGFARLPRAIVAVRGADNRSFLQGLISQDVERVTDARSAYGALLTPQGKYLHDFFLIADGRDVLIDCEAGRAGDLVSRLARFRLRAEVGFETRDTLCVTAVFGAGANAPLGLSAEAGDTVRTGGLIALTDPRDAALGCRVVGARSRTQAFLGDRGLAPAGFEAYDALRISLEVPDGSRDMDIEKSTLLESNFEALNGIDWDKGCYMGQELTARTKYRGLVKRRLSAFRAAGPSQAPGLAVMSGGRAVGKIRSRSGDNVLASVRLDALEDGGDLTAGGDPLRRLRS